ncbi:MAG: LptF/LptG family permease [Spirochaetaceae bacterium]|jgi:lipopolysaccharide export system permease protein|nr:LptF/LptG family permease [Spirochaetaceae bacterium]
MILDRYIVKHFLPVFFVALSMFVTLVLLIDLFVNLVNYLTYDATFKQIMLVSYYYIPKSVAYAIPVSLLFAVAYSLGDLYARNELISIISSGIPFWRLSYSLLIIGLIMSGFSFFFDDRIVIPTLKIKNQLTKELKHQQNTDSSAGLAITTNDGNRVYYVDYYDYENVTLNGVSVIERSNGATLVTLIRAQSARWSGEYWNFSNAVIYEWKEDDSGEPRLRVDNLTPTVAYTEDPELFRRSAVDPADLSARDAKYLVNDLKKVGHPFTGAEADYYHRFSFPLTSFIVIILSLSMAGRFRKNILLMSLLTSLSIAVIYYIMEMISMMMGRLGQIPPIVGAWFPVVFFTAVGTLMVRFSKT